MIRALLLTFTVAAAAAILVAPVQAKSSGLTGEVGPGYSIEVKKANKDLKTIKAGTYRIKVEDKASIHNFHLKGPGLNKKTGISFTGETTWTIKLKPGTYTYQCDSHASSGMKGTSRSPRNRNLLDLAVFDPEGGQIVMPDRVHEVGLTGPEPDVLDVGARRPRG